MNSLHFIFGITWRSLLVAVGYFPGMIPAGMVSGTVKNSYNVKNEETTFHTGLYVCREPRQPWSEMWQEVWWFQ